MQSPSSSSDGLRLTADITRIEVVKFDADGKEIERIVIDATDDSRRTVRSEPDSR